MSLSSGWAPKLSRHSPFNASTLEPIQPVTGTPFELRPRIMATSCNVTVTSPIGRWNVWVTGSHLSTSAEISVDWL
ncbi:hypothetical protein PIB30_109938, partial [Stylosanthes scabra]|nr:hypothetical protein [Stylosanthes scabra]